MRKTFVEWMIDHDTPNTYFLTADVGYGVLEPLQEKMKDRFINVGIAEQSMIGIAAGLALSGKKVYTYTMCAFYLRCIEHIRNDLCYQELPVTMIGVGTGFDYEHLGTTHFAFEDVAIMNALLNIKVFTPYNKGIIRKTLDQAAESLKTPYYIRLSRFSETKSFGRGYKHLYPKEGGSVEYFHNKYKLSTR